MSIRADDILASLLGGVSGGVQAYQGERQRRRTQAGQSLQGIQRSVLAALQGGQQEAAAALVPQAQAAMSEAYDLPAPDHSVPGSPKLEQRPDLTGPQGARAIAAMSGVEAPKPYEFGFGTTAVDPLTREVIYDGGQARTELAQQQQDAIMQRAVMALNGRIQLQDDRQQFQGGQGDLNRAVRQSEGEAYRNVRLSEGGANRDVRVTLAQTNAANAGRRAYDQRATAYVNRELAAAEARAKATSGAAAAPAIEPTKPGETPEQAKDRSIRNLMAMQAASMQANGPRPGLTEEQRAHLRAKFLDDYAKANPPPPMAAPDQGASGLPGVGQVLQGGSTRQMGQGAGNGTANPFRPR